MATANDGPTGSRLSNGSVHTHTCVTYNYVKVYSTRGYHNRMADIVRTLYAYLVLQTPHIGTYLVLVAYILLRAVRRVHIYARSSSSSVHTRIILSRLSVFLRPFLRDKTFG